MAVPKKCWAMTTTLVLENESGGCRRQVLTLIRGKQRSRRLVGCLASSLSEFRLATNQPSASAAPIHEDKSATCPLHRAEPWWPSTNKTRDQWQDRDRYWHLSCHPALPLAAITILLREKASARDDWAAPSATPKKQKKRDWEAAAQVWKAFCWMIGLVQAEQMRMLWILRTPAGKMAQQGSSVLPFLPHWLRS